jgi:putative flippase GtrA
MFKPRRLAGSLLKTGFYQTAETNRMISDTVTPLQGESARLTLARVKPSTSASADLLGSVPAEAPSLTGDRLATVRQLARYTVVGGCAFVIDISTLFVLTSWLGVHYLLAAAAGFCAGLLTNYALSIRWVFDRRRVRSAALEFQLFAGIGLIGLALNEVLMWAMADGVGIYYLNAKIAATVGVYFWNFAARKYVLFS